MSKLDIDINDNNKLTISVEKWQVAIVGSSVKFKFDKLWLVLDRESS